MKELNKVDRNGYITQGLDLTLRARTVNNEIICLDVSPEGTTGTCKGMPVELPEVFKSADRIVYLVQILRKSQLVLEDGKVTLVPFMKARPMMRGARRAAPMLGACAGDACAANAIDCAGNVCAAEACAANAVACEGNACAADACAANAEACAVAGCGLDGCVVAAGADTAAGCAGDACAANADVCAAAGCAGDACAAASGACAAQGCLGNACAVDVGPCAADGQLGPCLINVPYCPFIL